MLIDVLTKLDSFLLPLDVEKVNIKHRFLVQ
jgi:hypothetical protein